VASSARHPSFCVYGADEALFHLFSATIAAIRDRHPRFRVALMAPDAKARMRLASRHPDATVIAPPAALDRLRATWAKRLMLKCFVVLGDLDEIDPRSLNALRRRAIPVVVIAGSCRFVRDGALWNQATADHYLLGKTAVGDPRGTGIDPARVTVIEGIGPDAIQDSAVARIVDALSPFLARYAALERSRRPHPLRQLEATLLRLLPSTRIRRLDTLAALRDALGAPQCIVCLGNGPSSEDRALLAFRYDALFRVKHRWLDRGFLAEPDMVFTGSMKTLRRVRHTIFGFSSVATEAMLLHKWLPRSLFRSLTFFTPERAGTLPRYPSDTHVPTNGAIMLATAVALAPKSLIVAGIDLFSDPRGAYPDNDPTVNAYAAAHDARAELAFILQILDAYRGELLILGNVLQEQWTAHRRAHLPAP
jgi:hypothetical protein